MKKLIYTLAVALTAVAIPFASATGAPKGKKTQKTEQVKKVGQTEEEVRDSLNQIVNAAKKGNADAQNTVGGWYYIGRHFDKDYRQAAEWWLKAAKQDNAQALGNLGLCYQTGHGVTADSIRAVGLYKKSLKLGNPRLLARFEKEAKEGKMLPNLLMAEYWMEGLGGEKNNYKASEYLTTAADKGSDYACRELGVMLLNAKQPADAFKYFEKGYKLGDACCTFYYGRQLCEGMGVKKDLSNGMIAIQKAAEMNFPNAELYLANAYYEGNGVHKDAEQGFKWMERAAQGGLAKAQYQTAMKLVNGDGCAVNYDVATKWFTVAVRNNLGGTFKRACEKGGDLFGSPYVTYLEALRSYDKDNFDAALKGAKELQKSKVAGVKAAGQNLEARVLSNKDYAKKNLKNAVKLYTKSADADNATACYILAELYFTGTQVAKDDQKGQDLMVKAAKLGSPEANCYLANMCYEGRGVKKDLEKAVYFYKQAGLLMDQNSAKHLSDCYANGLGGLTQDQKKADEVANSYFHKDLKLLIDRLP